MSKINETNYPRRTQANYADTDMLVIQAAGGNTYTTRLEDMREDYEATLAPTLSALQDDVNENLATVEGSTASKAYAKGDFLVFGGRLCKAKTSIAVNATLVLDTNIELASVGGELSSISSHLASKLDKSGAIFSFNNAQIASDNQGDTKLYTNGLLKLAGDTEIYLLCNNGIYAMSPTYGSYKPITASAFTVGSSRLIKENIKALSDDEAKKILDVEAVAFDYKESFGGQRDQYGVIAEDVEKIIPFVVSTPETYDESTFDESKGAGQPLKSVDYSKFVPYLIRMIQIQQAEIDELKKRL